MNIVIIISYVNQTNVSAYSYYICAGGDGCNRIVVCKPRVFKDTLETVELGWDELQERSTLSSSWSYYYRVIILVSSW